MMKKILATLGIALAAATSPAELIIGFTSGEGYSSGDLNGQNSWNANVAWDVSPFGGGNANTVQNGVMASFGGTAIQLAVGQSYHLMANFQFNGSYTAGAQGASTAQLFGLGIASANTTTYSAGNTADTTMQLLGNNDSAGTSAFNLTEDFATISGINKINGFNTGDQFQLDYMLTLGEDAAGSFYEVELRNLTDLTSTGIGTISGIDASVYTALTGAGGYAFMRSSFNLTSGGITGMQVDSLSLTLVPEPSSIALLGFALLGVLAHRRRA